MKNRFWLTMALIGVLLLFGCINPFPSSKDCGDDMACFKESAKKCEAAQVTSEEDGMSGLLKVSPDGENCKYYLKITKVDEGADEEMEGLEMTCTTSIEDAKNEISVGLEKSDDECEGSLFEYLTSEEGE
ncbi:MAG: hypothetical protein ABIH99_01495 [Candidatus Micrarchaeota archaeon]